MQKSSCFPHNLLLSRVSKCQLPDFCLNLFLSFILFQTAASALYTKGLLLTSNNDSPKCRNKDRGSLDLSIKKDNKKKRKKKEILVKCSKTSISRSSPLLCSGGKVLDPFGGLALGQHKDPHQLVLDHDARHG